MFQDSSSVKQNHERFIKKICESGIVWALGSNDGFATSCSNEYEDEEGEPIELVCFWSDRALAQACAKDEWAQYNAESISLSEFLENWCVGLANDGVLLGSDFDENLSGYEAEPLDVIIEVVEELKKMNKELSFSKFQDINDLYSQAKAILDEE